MPQRSIGVVIGKQRILTAAPETTVLQAAKLMKRMGLGTVMVVEHEQLVGIFTERDVLCRVVAEGRDATVTPLARVMTRNPETICPDKPFRHALHMMFEGGFRHVPVVKNGKPVGMVSARDALAPEMAEFESDLLQRDHIADVLG
jgi:CBS domain-containing protein